ncbi:MAG: glycosyltransferase family 39 protein [Planctomycetaceae bacterium]
MMMPHAPKDDPGKAVPMVFVRIELRYRRLIVAAIVGIHVALCMWGAYVHSPTVDEPAYLASGLSHWQLGRFDLCKVSPPLVRLVAAIPVMLAQPGYDWKDYKVGPGVRSEHAVGRSFLVANGERSFWLFTIGRWGCIPFSLIGAFVCYRWAFEFFGVASGYAALVLWCFSPNILAHAQLLTPDIGVTALCIAACYTFWRWSETPTWGRSLIWGATLGVALLAKTNAIVLFSAFPAICLITCIIGTQRREMQIVFQMLVGITTAIYVLNLGYGFEGTCQLLGDYKFVSTTFAGTDGVNRFEDSLFRSVPVPVPAAFLEGIDLQRRDFENTGGSRKTYFRGNWYDHGWWWYYFYAVAVKIPVGTLLLCAVSPFLLRKHIKGRAVLLFVAFPGILLFGLPCSQTGFGHSLRYILPAAPFAFLFAAGMLSQSNRTRLILSMLVMATVVASSLRNYPHTLSYFNELAGGPQNGHFHLLDGNVDWGQDLLFIQEWLAKNREKQPVYVAYWGFLPVKDLGLDYASPAHGNENLPPGTYLISVNFLRGEYRQKRPELETLATGNEIGTISPAIRILRIQDPRSQLKARDSDKPPR